MNIMLEWLGICYIRIQLKDTFLLKPIKNVYIEIVEKAVCLVGAALERHWLTNLLIKQYILITNKYSVNYSG